MGNIQDADDFDVARKAIIPFRVRNNGFQVDYQILKFRSFTKAKVDQATDTKYDDTFLELNTRSRIVGDIRKVLTISAESISEDYANLRKNYYSRLCFAILTGFIGLVMTNVGWSDNTEPKGRVLIIFGGLMLMLTVVTMVIVAYTDRKLKIINKQFVQTCVKILQKEKIVTWGASFQHILFDIIYPYNGKSGAGAVILTPNPYFEMMTKTTDDLEEMEIKVNDPNHDAKLPVPMPQWVLEQSVSTYDEHKPLMAGNGGSNGHNGHHNSLMLPPSDGSEHMLIPPAEISSASSSESLRAPSDADDDMDRESDHLIQIEEPIKNGLRQVRQAPKPYTGFDDISKEHAKKIQGDLVQRYFHETPEEMEGYGQDTQDMELLGQLKEEAVQK